MQDAVNGLVAIGKASAIERLSSVPGVLAVEPSRRLTRNNSNSNAFTGVASVWEDLGFTGKDRYKVPEVVGKPNIGLGRTSSSQIGRFYNTEYSELYGPRELQSTAHNRDSVRSPPASRAACARQSQRRAEMRDERCSFALGPRAPPPVPAAALVLPSRCASQKGAFVKTSFALEDIPVADRML